MKTIKGPALFLGQFAGDTAPFDTWDGITKWAAECGYVGVQVPTWAGQLIDLKKAASNQDYCDEFKGVARALNSGGIFVIVMMHPHFRGPKETSWGWDEKQKTQFRRVDRYLLMTARRFAHARTTGAIEASTDAALQKVGLSLAEVRGRFPHELSGGQLQRTAIARALIPGPALIVADEPVSMVDASLRMSIVNLFKTLRDDLRVSIIYITHDLATAYYISDRIIVMQKGRVVESGAARTVLDNPQHPYSILLKQSVLSPETIGEGILGSARAEDRQRPRGGESVA